MNTLNNIVVTLGLASLLVATGVEANVAGHESANTNTGWSAQGNIPLDTQSFSSIAGNGQGAATGTFLGNNAPGQTGMGEGNAAGFPVLKEVFEDESHGHNHHSHGDHEFVNAVPEPETFALMLAGLGLVGWSVRRRRQG